jgi:hypothetical protein
MAAVDSGARSVIDMPRGVEQRYVYATFERVAAD